MAFLAASADTLAICAYAFEVAGRLDGLSAADTFVPEADRRAFL